MTWVVVNTLALAVAVWLVPGLRLTRSGLRTAPDASWLGSPTVDGLLTLVAVAVVLGLLNAVVRPVLAVVSLPLLILSLGLFWLVINAAMLLVTSALAGALGWGFHVDGFGPAFWGGLVVTVATWVLELLMPPPRGRGRRPRRGHAAGTGRGRGQWERARG